jgi:hypothetical protein
MAVSGGFCAIIRRKGDVVSANGRDDRSAVGVLLKNAERILWGQPVFAKECVL